MPASSPGSGRLWWLLALWLALAAPVRADDGVLVLGRISDDPKAHYEQLKPLLDYVVPRMADVGIREGRVLMARDAQQMQSYMRRGRVDWVTETAGTAMILADRGGAQPLLMTERDGVAGYRTLYFVRADSPVREIDDLRGRSIAFQNRFSTSSYYVPAIELLDRGLRLEVLLSPMDRPAPDSVGYVFGRSELNVSAWVHKGLVDAGAMSNLDWINPQRVPPSYRRDFRIVRETPEFPRALEMVRGDLEPRVRERLREVLLGAADDPDAREALLRFFKTTRFVPIDAQTARALDGLRRGVARVSREVE
ncbi:phosphate/phosphite/phosphonate ABC transporter substrate-binding protein [Luteimonas sp. M1R5S18]|uniref:Phosphate/phosphite/phosphonate ABC transporter substrate-binding protein n=1 Tax=Luteimonas rhizosphaericola TaxID=3042024 RepID=A0ABT6JN35_9GAMM|nr:phosphate/phosphite/phosphonate ABC transporter substrate-binding protein [Luteimonas rhizosphaericola]MDH5832019.1 phosphate/phosphite/phosphonate ABC transporter substrate-binding protein [Luteimonas rhizosphaericola]